jgi:phosphoserine phosphatase RsbU/P
MKVLVAEDDAFYSRILQSVLRDEYEVLIAEDGNRAWKILQSEEAPRLALLDWQMPGLDGLEVCRKVRANPAMDGFYLVIATVRQSLNDVLAGFEAGANDYITKPFHAQELRARLRVGGRVIELQAALASRVAQLQDALSRVKQLQGLLPICSYCKRIRDDHDYWQQVETYMSEHSQATFTHGICPECYEKFFKTELEELRKGK